MSIHLPEPIAAYIAAENALDPDAVAACFTVDATVRDEGRDRRGHADIHAWKRETARNYRPTITPTGLTQERGVTRLAAIVTGDFPGSSAALTFSFTLNAGQIARLEIGV